MRILLRAPVFSMSGYGVHSRQIARWLIEKYSDVIIQPVQWGNTPWYINPDALGGFIGKMMKLSSPVEGRCDISFQVQLPNEWSDNLANVNIGVTAGIETDICNPNWLECIMRMDHVVVPSSFTKSVFEKTLALCDKPEGSEDLLDRVSVIPESYIFALDQEINDLELNLETNFNFLAIGQLTAKSSETDRKNTFNLIKWFCEEFRCDNDVGLVLKTNSGRDTKIDRSITECLLKSVLNEVRKGEFPRVHLLHGAMSEAEIASLYHHSKIHAFVSTTRGEGYGLPLLEASRAGLPVITTNWSGHLDFLRKGKFIKLDFELRNIPKDRIDGNIFIDKARWAEVSEQDVKKKLRKFKESPSIPQTWAKDLSLKIKENYSHDIISCKYDEFMRELK